MKKFTTTVCSVVILACGAIGLSPITAPAPAAPAVKSGPAAKYTPASQQRKFNKSLLKAIRVTPPVKWVPIHGPR